MNELLQLGGNGTISKLRGLVKDRLNLIESIKSVPLKAFLNAYPTYFSVMNNRVSLKRFPPGFEQFEAES